MHIKQLLTVTCSQRSRPEANPSYPQATGGGGGDWSLESAVGILSLGVLRGRVTNVITRRFKGKEIEENNANAGVKSVCERQDERGMKTFDTN